MNKQEAIEAVGVAESATTTDCISVREIKKMDKWDKQDAIKMLKSKMDGSVDTSYEWCETIRMAIEALKLIEGKEFEYDSVYYKGKCDGLENALSFMKNIINKE